MPRRRAGVPYASGQSSQAVRFLDTRNEPNLGVYICQRCQTKRRYSQLREDGNINKFYVCLPEISPGCWDQYDPLRLPAPPPDDLRLPFVRPDVPLTVPPADAAQLPLQPPPQDD
jgi:hypothetical protein